jgi:hypothetical protein
MERIRVTQGKAYAPPWEAEPGEEIVMDPQFMNTPIRDAAKPSEFPHSWVQVKFPIAVYDAHQRIYQPLAGKNAVEHATMMGSRFYGDKLPSEKDPSKRGWLRATFLFSDFPTGELEKKVILASRESEFNRLATLYPERYGVFTCAIWTEQWEQYLDANSRRRCDPYDQIEYLIRSAAGLVASFEDHKARPVTLSSSPSQPLAP